MPWGWTSRVRGALAILAAGLAVVLAITGWEPSSGPPAAAPRLRVDPNTAPAAVLQTLPRIGPAMARRIIEERGRRPFRSLDDLDRRVRGIGPATRALLEPYLRFGTLPGEDSRKGPSGPGRPDGGKTGG